MLKSRILIAYDGSSFAGWQKQSNGSTVQGEIERAISLVLRSRVQIYGASRTDKGVHALGQVAHFEHCLTIDSFSFLHKINGILPSCIRVLSYDLAANDFHSQYGALEKIYTYDLHTAPYHLPQTHSNRLRVSHLVDINKMAIASRLFIGEHDFFGFQNSHRNYYNSKIERSTVRTVFKINIYPIPAGMRISVSGNGFLYKMVRNIVGALLAFGKDEIDEASLLKILKEKKRSFNIIKTAPAHGLRLQSIRYEPNIIWPNIDSYDLEAWM